MRGTIEIRRSGTRRSEGAIAHAPGKAAAQHHDVPAGLKDNNLALGETSVEGGCSTMQSRCKAEQQRRDSTTQ
jgi:hypothetical protein